MARSIYCSTCKKEKESGRENESRCKACKSQAYKEKRARQRAEAGIEPYGSGRSLYCYDCKSIKERRDYGYCNACRRKKDNENRIAKGITKKHQDGLCPQCGDKKPSSKWSYCLKCNNANSAKWKRENEVLSEEQHFRKKVRMITRYAVRSGKLHEYPCEVCGNVKVEAHHDDYYKPLDVRWLCRKHHQEHHKNELQNKDYKNGSNIAKVPLRQLPAKLL